jgi:hypothetical protein
MWPSILHGGRQRDGCTPYQLGVYDIDVVMREIGSHVCIKRDFLGRRLGGSQSRRGHAARDK